MLQTAGTTNASTRSGPTIHNGLTRKWGAPVHRMARRTALNTAAQALFPWHAAEYPGVLRGFTALFAGRTADATVRDWRRGKRQPALWAIETVLTALSTRIEALQHARALLAAELEKRNAKP